MLHNAIQYYLLLLRNTTTNTSTHYYTIHRSTQHYIIVIVLILHNTTHLLNTLRYTLELHTRIKCGFTKLSLCLSASLSICLTVYLSVCLPVCLQALGQAFMDCCCCCCQECQPINSQGSPGSAHIKLKTANEVASSAIFFEKAKDSSAILSISS